MTDRPINLQLTPHQIGSINGCIKATLTHLLHGPKAELVTRELNELLEIIREQVEDDTLLAHGIERREPLYAQTMGRGLRPNRPTKQAIERFLDHGAAIADDKARQEEYERTRAGAEQDKYRDC